MDEHPGGGIDVNPASGLRRAGAATGLVLLGCASSYAWMLRDQYRQAPSVEVPVPREAPLGIMSGDAVIAAYGALNHLRTYVLDAGAKGPCNYSPEGLNVAVWRAPDGNGWIVRFVERPNNCGGPGGLYMLSLDWWEVYRVSDEGVVLGRDTTESWGAPPEEPTPVASPDTRVDEPGSPRPTDGGS
jgi:hypothetical protein